MGGTPPSSPQQPVPIQRSRAPRHVMAGTRDGESEHQGPSQFCPSHPVSSFICLDLDFFIRKMQGLNYSRAGRLRGQRVNSSGFAGLKHSLARTFFSVFVLFCTRARVGRSWLATCSPPALEKTTGSLCSEGLWVCVRGFSRGFSRGPGAGTATVLEWCWGREGVGRPFSQ